MEIKSYDIRISWQLSEKISIDKELGEKILSFADRLKKQECIWGCFSEQTIPQFTSKEEYSKKIYKDRDLLFQLFNIHRLHIEEVDNGKSDTLFGKEFNYIKRSKNILYVYFDYQYSIYYFIDYNNYDFLTKYSHFVEICEKNYFPFWTIQQPRFEIEYDCLYEEEQVLEFVKKGLNPMIKFNNKGVWPINSNLGERSYEVGQYMTNEFFREKENDECERYIRLPSNQKNILWNEFYHLDILRHFK